MAVNLVSLVMQFLTPDMIGRVAAALGLDRSPVQSAIGVAVPGLLAGLVALLPNLAVRKNSSKPQSVKPERSADLKRCLALPNAQSSGHRSCFPRCWASESKMYSSMPSVDLRGSAGKRVVCSLGCWSTSLWASSRNSKEIGVSARAVWLTC